MPEDGILPPCALNFDHVSSAERNRLGAKLANLPATRGEEARQALLAAIGFSESA